MDGSTLTAVGSALTGLERLDVSFTHVVGLMHPHVAQTSMLLFQYIVRQQMVFLASWTGIFNISCTALHCIELIVPLDRPSYSHDEVPEVEPV